MRRGTLAAPDIDVLAALADLRARVAVLEATEAARQRPTLGRDDRDVLARLLPAIVGAKGSALWLGSEAVRLDAVQLVVPGWKAGRLGKLLKRAIGVTADGLTVERIGKEGNAVLWRVLGVLPEFPSSGNSDAPPIPRRVRASSD